MSAAESHPDASRQPERMSAFDILKGKIDVDALEKGMRVAKVERIAAVEDDGR